MTPEKQGLIMLFPWGHEVVALTRESKTLLGSSRKARPPQKWLLSGETEEWKPNHPGACTQRAA